MEIDATLFLDIFSGENSPLSTATRARGIPTLHPVDSHQKVGGAAHNLGDPHVFEFFIRLAWSGCIALAAGSPPHSAYSILRELPMGPRALRAYENLEPRADLTKTELELFESSCTLHRNTIATLHVVYTMGGGKSAGTPALWRLQSPS